MQNLFFPPVIVTDALILAWGCTYCTACFLLICTHQSVVTIKQTGRQSGLVYLQLNSFCWAFPRHRSTQPLFPNALLALQLAVQTGPEHADESRPLCSRLKPRNIILPRLKTDVFIAVKPGHRDTEVKINRDHDAHFQCFLPSSEIKKKKQK